VTVFNAQGAAVGTAQFVRARIGQCTASRLNDVMDFRKDGKPGAGRIRYMQELVAERMCDAAMDHYVSPDMEHGLIYESEAKAAYTKRTGLKVVDTEFTPHPSIQFFGATPDGLVLDDGLAEFKCPRTTTFIAWKAAGVVPAEHKPQMIGQCLVTGRDWNDFVAYDPRIKNESSRLFIARFVPTDSELMAIEDAVKTFLSEVDELFDRVTTT